MTGGELRASLDVRGGQAFVEGGIFNTGGFLTSGIFIWGNAFLEMHNVSIELLHTAGLPQATINVYSGAIQAALWAEYGSTVNIYGGDMVLAESGLPAGYFDTEFGGVVNIYGGNFPAGTLIQGPGTVVITGDSFNYPLGAIPDEDGVVTGVLADGTPFEFEFTSMLRGEYAPTTIILRAVPEPSTWAIMALGTAGLLAARRRNK